MTYISKIASLITEDANVSPYELLDQFVGDKRVLREDELAEHFRSYGATLRESDITALLEEDTSRIYQKLGKKSWKVTTLREYEEYSTQDLPEIGDGGDLEGINSPTQDQDMMGQGLGPNTYGGYDEEDESGTTELWCLLKDAEKLAREEEMMITQEDNVEGADKDRDWDEHYPDAPDGKVVKLRSRDLGEGDSSKIVKWVAKTVMAALNKENVRDIFNWVIERADAHPEIRDEIIKAGMAAVQAYINKKA